MTLTQVREPPHIPNANAEAHTGEDVLGFVVPLGPVPGLLLLHPLQILIGRNPFLQSWVREKQLHGDSDEAEMLRWLFSDASRWDKSERSGIYAGVYDLYWCNPD